ncbi:uncharacterized protein LOC113456346 [Microtus ochrogaster]|uniref:Uncharacterized protein LOC113456346 n=1 Tax=Microtus ochrogaster TaxID=79684 RepID=A0ABM1U447_MICOH|nr:uncharacterized protein LOC113456346 [Microtus ochrogaster]
MERGAARLCRGLTLSGRAGWRERTPDDGKRMDAMYERMDVGREKPVTLEPPEPCLQRVAPPDTSAACCGLMILWILIMGVGTKEQWPSGTLPAPWSTVLNWVFTLRVSEYTAPTFWPQAVLGRGLDSPLTPPLQPACIRLQLPSHTHPGLAAHTRIYQDKLQFRMVVVYSSPEARHIIWGLMFRPICQCSAQKGTWSSLAVHPERNTPDRLSAQPLSGVRSCGEEVISPGASAPSSGETKSAA